MGIEGFRFPDTVTTVGLAVKPYLATDVWVSDVTSSPRKSKMLILATLPGGYIQGFVKHTSLTVTLWADDLASWKVLDRSAREAFARLSTGAVIAAYPSADSTIVPNDTTQIQGYFTVSVQLMAAQVLAP